VDYLVAKTVGLNYTYGVLIQSVTKNSPAERAGLKGGTKVVTLAGRQIYVGGDLILALDQHTIKTMEDLSSYLERETVPGQSVELTVIRDGQTLSIPVTIGIRP
ncbi:MAG: PDZ domain-containing protein, partial [Candidatus Methanomethylicia archaeon]|nr:PDZ domain-containing protein [Candidatus Methanomethylicia archaeon]